ncbi:MAG: hypothetical protein P4L91_03375, partial [Burkholderiaceae bacterium]|nr:hypothetical protein [Burkholderiaceae bacterium]
MEKRRAFHQKNNTNTASARQAITVRERPSEADGLSNAGEMQRQMVEGAALFHPCIMISWFDKKSDHVSNLEGHLKIERLDAVSTLWPQAS